jgi:hypothetical protein
MGNDHQEDTSMAIYQEQEGGNLPFNQEVMFSNHKNEYKKGIEKRQTKLMQKIGFLKPFLQDDEEILLVTTGCSPISFVEELVTGWVLFYLKRALLVFTNKRIFHIPTKTNFAYRRSIAHIFYADCALIQLKWGKLTVEYQTGKKEKFLYIASQERKKIQTLMNQISAGDYHSHTQERVHLCPHCTTELEKNTYRCPSCQLEFKDKQTARKVSIIFPGGGYFYTRHPWLGIGDALTETLLIALVIVTLIATINSPENSVALIIYIIALILEKAISVYHSNHFVDEYIPKEKEIPPLAP